MSMPNANAFILDLKSISEGTTPYVNNKLLNVIKVLSY